MSVLSVVLSPLHNVYLDTIKLCFFFLLLLWLLLFTECVKTSLADHPGIKLRWDHGPQRRRHHWIMINIDLIAINYPMINNSCLMEY